MGLIYLYVDPARCDASLLARTTTPADEYRGAQKEGIKVHGHWTIDIRNPDGTLAQHHEFENALIGAVQAVIRVNRTSSWIDELRGMGPYDERVRL